MEHITDRLFNRKWGVFTHYLAGVQNKNDLHSLDRGNSSWDDCVNEFDVQRVAKTLQEVNAGYYFLTLMQGSREMLAPNTTYDRITGNIPGDACSTRDIPLELYSELTKKDIDLYLYYTGDGPYKDEKEGKAFGFTEPRERGVTLEFVEKWASVLEEYAIRYGDKVKGWWIDGCYADFLKYSDELLKPYYDACKKGNPNALVAFNDGIKPVLSKYYQYEDFTCGEYNDFIEIPKLRFIDGAQAHILAPLGISPDNNPYMKWCRPGCSRNKQYMLDYVRRVNDAGGVVTIDVAIYRDGSFDPAQVELLSYIGENIER